MDRLMDGFRKFRSSYYEENKELFDSLAQGQHPRYMVISCCDSRVDPALIFNCAPGELFVVRNVANLVPPYQPDTKYHGTSAALEFAVRGLNVEIIVVLGHARCGGIRALVTASDDECTDFINPWMAIAKSARDISTAVSAGQSPEVTQRLCEHESLKVSLANLMSFPWVAERVREGRLSLHGMYFDIDDADLECLDPITGVFQKVSGLF